ncbi:peptidylprolyl isomerase [Monaibacterium marinum]|uniref:Peptidyl-prolyl cis-trans isomerase n=1 Tax=Pontivivens marinum TaxID=1690039 RepID=A0A2C9CVL9_9RHOB|nr:peptidylprolyl isomerase [Monaibacterium marinum]SOH94439.1 peptidylprolyl isomerase [Monaibacterium marinum]
MIARLAFVAALAATPLAAQDLVLELESGEITIALNADAAPLHVERIVTLANQGAYDGVAFHRVIEGFMAQTGDVRCGVEGASCPAGTGGSDLDNLPAEFSDLNFGPGVVGMARSQNPNSANSQFFIMFEEGAFLNGQYTVIGEVSEGMDVVNGITRGAGSNGAVSNPDRIISATIAE